jgi:hypothetical protein
MLADAEFDSERNYQHIRHTLQGQCVIPAKRGRVKWWMLSLHALLWGLDFNLYCL